MDSNRRSFPKEGGVSACSTVRRSVSASADTFDPRRLTPRPPLGWNSYDCLGSGNEPSLLENLDAFVKKFKPFGYEYFVVDIGWFAGEGGIQLDEFGRYMPGSERFPNGFGPIIKRAHAAGVKFGLWMMRGVSKKAYELNLPIKGTPYHLKDITDTTSECPWGYHNYGVNMDKPGAQAYYDSLAEPLIDWGVDFVKYDDMVPHPREIEAAINGLERYSKKIVVSLSPGDRINVDHLPDYRRANMLRITADIWDNRESLQTTFQRWEQMQNYGGDGFWLDLDMIPFGYFTRSKRSDKFTLDQKQTFMAQRALAASPLFMGGDLTSSDETSIQLITHRGMLACNQNGVVGKLVDRKGDIDVWRTPHKTNQGQGWLGVFNRSETATAVRLGELNLGLDKAPKFAFYDVWKKSAAPDLSSEIQLNADAVLFLRYRAV